MFLSLVALFGIENTAIQAPDHPMPGYTAVLHIKGIDRYVTPEWAHWDAIAHAVLNFSFPVCAIVMCAAITIQRRLDQSG